MQPTCGLVKSCNPLKGLRSSSCLECSQTHLHPLLEHFQTSQHTTKIQNHPHYAHQCIFWGVNRTIDSFWTLSADFTDHLRASWARKTVFRPFRTVFPPRTSLRDYSKKVRPIGFLPASLPASQIGLQNHLILKEAPDNEEKKY